MANGPTHLVAGLITGVATSALDKPEQASFSHHPVIAGALGAFGGKLPDLLEPSLNNPHHRQFFHSFLVVGALGYGLKKLYEWEPPGKFEQLVRATCFVSGAAYLSHLALDAMTKRSLPVIGKL